MTKTTSLIIGAILIVGIGGLVYFQNMDSGTMVENTNTNEPSGSNSQGGNTQTNEAIASSEITQHKDASSCWSSINGNVYDLTSWIPQHPGGPQAILKLCGKDGSEEFNEQHGGAALQAQTLAGFKIGILAQ